MSKKRICLNCGGAIPEDRQSGTKYCKNSCKARYHEKKLMKELFGEKKEQSSAPKETAIKEETTVKKEVPKPVINLSDGLRGVAENNPKEESTTTPPVLKKEVLYTDLKQISDTVRQTKVKTQAYKEALAKKEKAEADVIRIENLLLQCNNNLTDLEIEKQKLPSLNHAKRYKAWHNDIADLEDRFENESAESFHRSELQNEIQEKISSLNESKAQLEKMLPLAKKTFEDAQKKLNTTPQFEPEPKESLMEKAKRLGLFQKKNQDEEVIQKENKEAQPEQDETIGETETKENKTEETEKPITETNEKLITSSQLRRRKYKCFPFGGKWKEFFGEPSYYFHLAVHGLPGEGKSTFCIQFADYLAKMFGKVVYISAEEGFEKTLSDKVAKNKIDNPYLFFANIKSYEEIEREIKNEFHFIFIDSLDTLGINAIRLKELKKLYPQSAFITISQSTKNGGMRGSQEIVHDSDITAKVENSFAVTTKNRFQKRGMRFKVDFPDAQK